MYRYLLVAVLGALFASGVFVVVGDAVPAVTPFLGAITFVWVYWAKRRTPRASVGVNILGRLGVETGKDIKKSVLVVVTFGVPCLIGLAVLGYLGQLTFGETGAIIGSIAGVVLGMIGGFRLADKVSDRWVD